MMIGIRQSVISRNSRILISRSSGPVQSGMTRGGTLIDALWQRPHRRDAVGDLLPSAACRRLPAWHPARSRSRRHRPCADLPGSCHTARAGIDRSGSSTVRAPRFTCRRRPSLSRCPQRSPRAPAPPSAFADNEPKLMPAMVIGIFKCSGFLVKREPSTTLVSHRLGYPSSGYRDIDAPRTRSLTLAVFRFAPPPRIS